MADKNNKPIRKTSRSDSSCTSNPCRKHDITKAEITKIQKDLLSWYDKNQRVLPWRDIAKYETDPDKRGYAVWVSEIMLQQTQVTTVISYFNKWMKNWPTVSDLAAATLEEVNKVWAGLGYYSRARRLHEGANIVVEKLNGAIPQNVQDLMKLIPGIGQYSASAIASVAFQKPVGVVDGNVIRVLSRVRVIGAHVTQSGVRDHLWDIANKIVSVKRPGDFNQALMELGAVVCTPQNPKCIECPISANCYAYIMAEADSKVGKLDSFLKNSKSRAKSMRKIDIPDIEDAASCNFCIEPSVWKENPQVTLYPCKVEKKSSRIERVGVVVIKVEDSYLMTKRPEKGLLGGLWEFPSVIFGENSSDKENVLAVDSLLSDFGVPISMVSKRKYIKEVLHIFSHIRATYVVEYLELNNSIDQENVPKEVTWSTEEEIKTSAVSTAMKKVFEAVKCNYKNGNKASYSGIIEEALAASAAKKRGRAAKNKNKKVATSSPGINCVEETAISAIPKEILKTVNNRNKKRKLPQNGSVNLRDLSVVSSFSDNVLDDVKNSCKNANLASQTDNRDLEISNVSADIVIEYENVRDKHEKINENLPNVPVKKMKKNSESFKQTTIKTFFKQK